MKARRYSILEGYRGVAAFMVMTHHFIEVSTEGPWPQPKAELAVDLFFLISGFVLQDVYGRQFGTRLNARSFLLIRFQRLAPLLALGALLGIIRPFLALLLHAEHAPSLNHFLVLVLTQFTMLPSPLDGNLFPLNIPVWSTFFQIMASIVFALVLWRARMGAVVLVALCSLAGLCLGAWTYNTLNIGWSWDTFAYGFARIGFSFTAGVLVSRIGLRHKVAGATGIVLPLVALLGVLLVPISARDAGAYDLLGITVLNPLLLLMALGWQAPERLRPLCDWLGEVSFPLFALHYPLLLIDMAFIRRVPQPLWLNFLGFAIVAVFVSALAVPFDRAARAWLERVLRPHGPSSVEGRPRQVGTNA
jgi:peptidoglycan/LPS O-acetylase OafA/YrhL